MNVRCIFSRKTTRMKATSDLIDCNVLLQSMIVTMSDDDARCLGVEASNDAIDGCLIIKWKFIFTPSMTSYLLFI